MPWTVLFQNDFAEEFASFDEEVRVEMRAMVGHLAKFGPAAKRPQVDTLKGIANFEPEGISLHCGGRRLARCFCFRCEASGDRLGGGR